MDEFIASATGVPQAATDTAWGSRGRDTVGDSLSALWE
jgi:hypothetical protein